MDIAGELAAKLRSMRQAAPHGRKIAAVHLFGIIYAQELEGMDLLAIAVRAGCRPSLRGEIRKGVVLAEYVEPISYFSTDWLQ